MNTQSVGTQNRPVGLTHGVGKKRNLSQSFHDSLYPFFGQSQPIGKGAVHAGLSCGLPILSVGLQPLLLMRKQFCGHPVKGLIFLF